MAKLTDELLHQKLKEGSYDGVYMFYGEETYLKQQYVALLKKKLVDAAFEDFNYHFFEGKKASLDEILMTAETVPMLSEYTLVVVRDYPLLRAPSDLTRLKDYLADMPESTVLVFWFDALEVEDNPKKSTPWTKVIKLIAGSGTAVNFERKSEQELVKRLCNFAKKKKVSLNSARASMLVDIVGTDMQTLMNELEKIIAYVGEGGEITKKEIELLAVPSLEANIYKLTDCLMHGDSLTAYAIIGTLLLQKERPERILALLADCYIEMYRMKCAKASGKSISDVCEDFGVPKSLEWRVRKSGNNAAAYDAKTLRKALDVLAHIDELLKSSPVDNRILLEETVSKLLILRNR